MPVRDQAARAAARDLLENVPYASHEPITPYCGDPYCPYHHPRPWGSALPPSACSTCSDGGSLGHSFTRDPAYYGPAPSILNEPLPTPVTPEFPPQDVTASPATNGNVPVPPVIVEEVRRPFYGRRRTAMRRLPAVNGSPGTRSAVQPHPGLQGRQTISNSRAELGIRTANRNLQSRPPIYMPRSVGSQRSHVGAQTPVGTQRPPTDTQQTPVRTQRDANGQQPRSANKPWWQVAAQPWWQADGQPQSIR